MTEKIEYLNISLSVGKVLELAEQAKNLILENKKTVSIAAWKNNNASEGSPVYKAEGVSVWKNTKETNTPETPNVTEEPV